MDERQRYRLKIDEAPDRAALLALDAELAAHPSDDVRALRFVAASRRARLRPRAGEDFAAAYGIAAVTGSPLYRYRLDDAGFDRLGADLARCGGYAALETGTRAGLFVLWAAEWFRRRYRGGGHRWQDLVEALGIPEDQARLRALTASGLARWRRALRTTGGAREYLATLAREGGFPVAAVEQGGRGWARDVLAAIVAPLLADAAAGQATAEAVALAQRERLPALYADDEFALLCADLALAVAEIRREAEPRAKVAGLPLAAWLAVHRPDWREALPLAVSGTAAGALLGELLVVEAAAVTGRGARAERLLARTPDGWRESLRVTFDGPIDGEVMRGIAAAEGRLRVFAAGELARALPGELGMAEPPEEGARGWTARSTKRVRGLHGVPFGTAVELELRSGERRIALVALPGGKPRRGRLLAMTVADADDAGPVLLRVEGSGSGSYVADELVLLVPDAWRVEASSAGETVAPLGERIADAQLWRVTGGAVVTDDEGDCFRLRTGQARDRRDRLMIDSHPVGWAAVSGDEDLFAGAPQVRASDPARGALFVRAIGSGAHGWRRAPSPLPVGHYEIGWRDGPLLLDRRRLAVIPAEATLVCNGRGQEASWTLSGWAGTRIDPAADAPLRVVGDTWLARPVARATAWFGATLRWDGAPPLDVRIGYPGRAAIARWDGTLLAPDERVTLADLRDLVALDGGAMRMFGELIEPGRRARTTMTWSFDGELPLSSAAADISSLLLPCPSIDASVRLGMLDGVETYWHVRQFALGLTREGGGLVASAGVVAPNAVVCGRSFAAPEREIVFGPWSLVVEANHRPFTLPPGARGGWLVYLRDGETVVSRPEILSGELPAPEGATPLARAMLLAPRDGLAAALDAVLDAGEPATVDALVALVCSLGRLPPATFEVLKRLPDHPAMLARMAFAAPPDGRDAVMALSDALPFAWCLLPRAVWHAAFEDAFARLLAQLAAVPDAAGYAMQAIAATIAAICRREPLLEPVLKDGFAAQPRGDVVQLFLQRAAHRLDDRGGGRRYRDAGLPLPADHLARPDHMLELLDAPYAAALAVDGRWSPGADDVRHVKAVARNFPTFFADALAASLKELQ